MQLLKQSWGRAGGASEPTFNLCNWSDSTRVKNSSQLANCSWWCQYHLT